MKRLISAIFIISFFNQNLFSQTYREAYREFFFDRLPSAKVEAMGKILSVGPESHFVSQSNPALLLQNNGLSAFYSHSTPYYLGEEFNFYYAGLSYNVSDFDILAFNFLHWDLGEIYAGYPDGTFKKINSSRKLFTVSYARELRGLFKLGINSNLFLDDINPDKSYKGFFFDLGILKNYNLIKNNKLEDNIAIGVLFKNIFNQGVKDERVIEYFPSIVRVGISNELNYFNKSMYAQSHFIGLTTAVEYQNVINYKYRTATKFGAELSLINFIFARCGYYDETQIKGSNGKGKLNAFTYGFGLNIDGSEWINSNFPLSFTFDYTSLPQPTYIVDFDDWDNFTIFSLRINYLFE